MKTFVISLTAAVAFAGVALGTAGRASASDPMAGNYAYHQAGAPQYRWTIFPTCVLAGCTLHVDGSLPGYGPASAGFTGDAKLVNDQWTMNVTVPDGLKCGDGSSAALSQVYKFDDATLTGTVTNIHAAVCGQQPSMTKDPFTLTYESPLTPPVELYPQQCPTFPNCAYNTEIPGQLGY